MLGNPQSFIVDTWRIGDWCYRVTNMFLWGMLLHVVAQAVSSFSCTFETCIQGVLPHVDPCGPFVGPLLNANPGVITK